MVFWPELWDYWAFVEFSEVLVVGAGVVVLEEDCVDVAVWEGWWGRDDIPVCHPCASGVHF